MTDLKYPGVGVCVIMLKDNKVLLARRISTANFGHNTFCLPGGKVDWQEEPMEAAKRETLEECGVTVNNLKFIGYSNDVFKDCDKHYVTLYFICRDFTGTPYVTEPNKCIDWKWYDINALPSPIFCDWAALLKDHLSK